MTPPPPELSPATEAVKTMQPCAFFSSGSAAFARDARATHPPAAARPPRRLAVEPSHVALLPGRLYRPSMAHRGCGHVPGGGPEAGSHMVRAGQGIYNRPARETPEGGQHERP